jgi:hypothetical protein
MKIVWVAAALVLLPRIAGAKEATVPTDIKDLLEGQSSGLLEAKVVDKARALGGTEVVVYEARWHFDARKAELGGDIMVEAKPAIDSTTLTIADVKTRKPYLDVELRHREAGGADFAYVYEWKDLDGDNDPELVLTRQKGRASDPAEWVYQVRYGRLIDVTAAAAKCKPASDRALLTAPVDGKADAGKAFNASLGAKQEAVRCALDDLLIATEHALPRDDAPLVIDANNGVVTVAGTDLLFVQRGPIIRPVGFPCMTDDNGHCVADVGDVIRLEGVVPKDNATVLLFAELRTKAGRWAVVIDASIAHARISAAEKLANGETAELAGDRFIVSGKAGRVWRHTGQEWDPDTVDDLVADKHELVDTKIIDRVRDLGGTKVVVFEARFHHDVTREQDERSVILGEGRLADYERLVVADLASRTIYLDVEIKRAQDGRSYGFAYAWKDLDGDKQPELVLTRKRGKDDAPEHIYQIRYGRFVEVTRGLAKCKQDGAALTAPTGSKEAFGRAFVDSLAKKPAAIVRCALGDLLIAAGHALPRDDAPLVIDPDHGVVTIADGKLLFVRADQTIDDVAFPCVEDKDQKCVAGASDVVRLEGTLSTLRAELRTKAGRRTIAIDVTADGATIRTTEK